MAFDAGAIEGTLTLDRSPFQKGMQAARDEARKFQSEKFKAFIAVELDGADKAKVQLDALAHDRKSNVKVDVDSSKLGAAKRDVDGIGGSLEKLALKVWSVKTLADGFKSLLGPALLATKAIGIGGAAGAVIALGGAGVAAIGPLTQLAGLAPLYVAGFGAAAVAMGTMKLATMNMGQAFKDADKGGAAFQKDLAKLAPSARSVVLEVRQLKPAFDQLQLGAQQSLFRGMATQIAQTANTLLPQLKRGLTDVGGSLGGLAKQGLFSLRTSLSGGGLTDILGNIARAIRNVQPAITQLIPAFVTVGRVATSFLTPVANGFSGLSVKFNTFIQNAAKTGELQGFIQGGINAFTTLSGIVGNLIVGLGNIVKAAAPLGDIVFGKLSLMTKAFKDLTGSSAGQKGLQQFFSSLQPVLATLGSLAATLAKTLAPVIPIVLSLANVLGKQLIGIIKDLGPGLQALGTILVGLTPSLGKIVDAVAKGLSGALKGLLPILPSISQAFNALAPVLGALVEDILTPFPALLKLVANVITTLAPAITPLIGVIGNLINVGFKALAPVILIVAKALAQLITQGLKAIAPYLPMIQKAMLQLGQALAQALAPLLPVIVKSFVQLLAAVLPLVPIFLNLLQSFEPILIAFTKMASAVLPVFVSIIKPIAPYLVGLAAAWWLVNAAMAANPIGIIIIAIAALATGIYELVKHFDVVVNFFTKTLPDVLRTAWGYAKQYGPYIITAIFPVAGIPLIIAKFWKPISEFFESIGGKIEGFFKGAGKWLLHIGEDVITGLWNGIKGSWGTPSGWLAGMNTRIGNFFKGVGSWLASEGSHLIGGLWNGIKSYWASVSNWFSGMGTRIGNFFAGISGWLYSEGFHLISGLFNGISTRWNSVYNWFKGIPGRFAANIGWAVTLVSKGGALIQGLFDGIVNKMKGIGGWIKRNVIDPIVSAVKGFFGIHSPSTVFAEIGGNLIAGLLSGMAKSNGTQMAKKIFGDMPHALAQLVQKGLVNLSKLPKKALNALQGLGGDFADLLSTTTTIQGKGSPGVGAWSGDILKALALLGQSPRWLPIVEQRMGRESGGDPDIVNKWDSNWIAGHPSVGLMQVIRGTFDAYAGPFKNIGPKLYGVSVNGLANIYSGLNYALHRYGSLSALLRPGGYAGGGVTKAGGELAWVGENGRELRHFMQPNVIHTKQKSENILAGLGNNDFDYEAMAAAIADALSGLDFTTTMEADSVALARVVKKGNKNLAWLGG